MQNRISLCLSTEATISLLEETSLESYKLFYTLGCFPAGVTKAALTKYLGLPFEKELSLLDQLSLLD